MKHMLHMLLLKVTGWYALFTIIYLMFKAMNIIDLPIMIALGYFLGMNVQRSINKYEKMRDNAKTKNL